MAGGRAEQGIVCCWTGTGASIAANKVPGIRAALCADAATADGARRWNDANVLAISLRTMSAAVLGEVLDAGSPARRPRRTTTGPTSRTSTPIQARRRVADDAADLLLRDLAALQQQVRVAEDLAQRQVRPQPALPPGSVTVHTGVTARLDFGALAFGSDARSRVRGRG